MKKAFLRCTRRIRDPLNYLIMQPTDLDQVTTAIATDHTALLTFYLPLHSAQYVLHRRYEAEQYGELVLPAGVPAPKPKPLTLTQDEAVAMDAERKRKRAAATKSPTAAFFFGNFNKDAAARSGGAGGGEEGEEAGAAPNSLNNTTDASTGETTVPLALVTLLVGENSPYDKTKKESLFERLFDPSPHPSLSLRVQVMDRIHWQRTCWNVTTVCRSICWGRLPQRIYSIDLDYKNAVRITGGPPGLGLLVEELMEYNYARARGEWKGGAFDYDRRNAQARDLFRSTKERLPLRFHGSEDVNGGSGGSGGGGKDRYTSLYCVEVEGLDFFIVLRDTGNTLFEEPRAAGSEKGGEGAEDRDGFVLNENKIIEGFLDNESALHRLSLGREVNMLGLGGSVYRQTLWSAPSLPNTADFCFYSFGSLFTRHFGCNPVLGSSGTHVHYSTTEESSGGAEKPSADYTESATVPPQPVASWLVRAVEKTYVYRMEGEVEDENDPNSATTYGDRSLTERVQKKAMNRYNSFKDDVRHRTYAEMSGEETPR